MNFQLNERAADLTEDVIEQAEQLRIEFHQLPCGGRVVDFGVHCTGSLAAGMALAEICMADWGEVALTPGDVKGVSFPTVTVTTDHPLAACLLSQYAGMQIQVDKYFAMGSGPMRAIAAKEELFKEFQYQEAPHEAVGILESNKLPDEAVFRLIQKQTGVPIEMIILLVAPVTSLAGSFQVVARSVETALHKLHELKFDMTRLVSAYGTAPLPPVAAKTLTGIGRTNDAILYGGRVTLWVTGDDESLQQIGLQVPSSSSEMSGKPFADIFKDANNDFYQIDPLLFSPAEVTFQNIETGNVYQFGKASPEIVKASFGL